MQTLSVDNSSDVSLSEIIDQNKDTELGTIEVDWAKPPALRDLKNDLEESQSAHDEQITKINEWLDHLHIRNSAKIHTKKNRSGVQPRLIRKQAEWRFAALSEPFLQTNELFNVRGQSWEDRRAAEQNKLLLNHQFNNRMNKNRFVDDYVRAAVEEGTAIVRVGWNYESEEIEREAPIVDLIVDPSFEQTLQEVAQLKESDPGRFETDVPEELKQALDASMSEQIAYRPQVVGYETIVETRVLKNHPTVEVCDFNNVIIDPTCNGDAKKARFIIYSFETSEAELEKADRYHNLDQIKVDSAQILNEPDHAANMHAANFVFKDQPRKRFVAHEYWGFIDVEGEGELTPVVITWVGNTIIGMENNPFPDQQLPFIMVPYLPVRRSVYGEPDGALLTEHQQIQGAVTRGMIDTMGRSANGQVGMAKNMLDTPNKRRFERGDFYEFNVGTDPRIGVHTHTFPEIPQSAQFMLQLQSMEAESLTGVKAFAGGLSGDAFGSTATGTRGVLDAASKRELGILRRLAQGVVEIGQKITAMNGVFLTEKEVVRVTNEKYVEVRRDEIQGDFDLELTISTSEEDNAKAEGLSFMLQTMGNSVDFAVTQKILTQLFKLQKMPELAKQMELYQPQPDPLDQQLKQLEIAKVQAEIAVLQSQAQENMAEAQLDSARANTEYAKASDIQATTDNRALDFVERESGVTQERELQKQGEQARGNMALEREKARLSGEQVAVNDARTQSAKTTDALLRAYLANTSQPVTNAGTPRSY